MKIMTLFAIIIVLALSIFIFRRGNEDKISNDLGITQGTVTKVFYRGKLPFCEFKYTVEGNNFTKKQEISKLYSKKVINNTYEVRYEKKNPKNAIIKF